MPKGIASLPRDLLKSSVVGAVVALAAYMLLQFAVALLIHCEVIGEGMLYPAVCVSAAVASFLGCGCSMLVGKRGGVLSASAVVAVFLGLTIVIGLLGGGSGAVGAGVTGIGVAMVAGGLLAAALAGFIVKGSAGAKKKRRKRR